MSRTRKLTGIAAGVVTLTAYIAFAGPAAGPDQTAGASDRAIALARELLQEPSSVRKRSGGMAVYSRAFTAYALVNVGIDGPEDRDEVRRLIDALIDQVGSPGMSGLFGSPESVGLRGHLALMLEGRARLGPLSRNQAALSGKLLGGLAKDVLAAGHHLIPTFGKRTWPADNEVLLAAFALALRRDAPIPGLADAHQAITQTLNAYASSGSLPPSEIDPRSGHGVDVPRGCALAWSVGMRGLHDPDAARALYSPFRREYLTEVGPLVGFREWPRGVDRPADIDSGPIVLGIGVAASGIGWGAARLAGHPEDASRLTESAASVLAMPLGESVLKQPIARAMWIWSETARPWL